MVQRSGDLVQTGHFIALRARELVASWSNPANRSCDRFINKTGDQIKERKMFHKVELIGNLGRDPEMRYLPDGKAVTTMSVATNRTYTKGDGEQVKETAWFRVSVFGKSAEACAQYLAKGRQVFVEGRLRSDDETGGPRVYQRNDGSYGASFEIVASNVKFLGGRGDTVSVEEAIADMGVVRESNEDEIPF